MDTIVYKVGDFGFFIAIPGECAVTKSFKTIKLESETYGVTVVFNGETSNNGFKVTRVKVKKAPFTDIFQNNGIGFDFGGETVKIDVRGE